MDAVFKIKQATKQGFIECEGGGCFDSSFPTSTTRRGRVQGRGQIAPTLMASNDTSLILIEVVKRGRKM